MGLGFMDWIRMVQDTVRSDEPSGLIKGGNIFWKAERLSTHEDLCSTQFIYFCDYSTLFILCTKIAKSACYKHLTSWWLPTGTCSESPKFYIWRWENRIWLGCSFPSFHSDGYRCHFSRNCSAMLCNFTVSWLDKEGSVVLLILRGSAMANSVL